MENTHFYEYGLGIDAEAYEKHYDVLQALLQEDNIYDNSNDNPFDHHREDSGVQLLSPVIFNIVMLILVFALTFIIPFVSQGLLRGMYLLKTILLGLSNGLIVAFPLLEREALKYVTNIEHSTPFRALLICLYLSEACTMLAATLSCVVMHEIHLCVTRMEVRQLEVGPLAKKIVACGVISFLVPALIFINGLVESFWWKTFFAMGDPIMAFIALVSCVGGTYMGVRTAATLWAAGRVSSSSHGGGGHRQKWHIYSILLAIVIAQWFQLIGDLVKAILVNARSSKCDTEKLAFADTEECMDKMAKYRHLFFILHRSVAGVLESVGFTCIMIVKKCLNDAA